MSSSAGLNELAPGVALREIRATLPKLMDWINWDPPTQLPATKRYWYAPAGTYTYHTITKLRETGPDMLELAAKVFAGGNRLQRQPWYPAFLGGNATNFETEIKTPFTQVQLGQARFDFGMRQPRTYNQIIASISPDESTRVVALRSVSGMEVPTATKLAYTLGPTADVFRLHEGQLYWHHVVTAAGAAILPGSLDRLLMNGLRLFKLDSKERQTYRDEAIGIQTMTRKEWEDLAAEIT